MPYQRHWASFWVNRSLPVTAGVGLALAGFVYSPSATAQEQQGDEADEMIAFNPPPELELNLLIQMVSDELSLKIIVDERVGNQRVRLLVPEEIPRASMRDLLESALQMKGFALTEDAQPGWLRVVEAKKLIDLMPPMQEDEAGQAKATSALTRVFKLDHYDPQKAEQVVRPYLTTPGGNLQIIAEQQLLIVTDYAPRVERIKTMLSLIDRPARDVEVRFHQVKHLAAAEASAELTRILQARSRATPGSGAGANNAGSGSSLEILPQDRTGNLVLIGDPDQLDDAIDMLASIDIDLGLETRLYRFASVSPVKVDDLVQNLIDPGAKDRLYRSSPDEENGLLVVTTTEAIHKQVASVQADLDREIEAVQPVVKHYKLMNTKAADVLVTIQEVGGTTVLYEGGRYARPAQPAPGIIPGSLPENSPGSSVPGSDSDQGRVPIERPLRGGFDGFEGQRALGQADRVRRGGEQSSVQTDDAVLVADENSNTIIVKAEPARQTFYANLIEQLDQSRPQVMIEVTLIAMSTSDGKSVGVEISRSGDAGDDPQVISFSSFGLSDGTDAADLLAASGTGFNGIILSEDIANVVVRALKTDGQSRVISTPKLLINDNAEGSLSSTLNIPFESINNIDSVTTQSLGGTSDAGTTISLEPQISEGDHIKLGYEIEFSSFGEGGSTTLPPPKSSQNISSEITVPDGHTVVIGGLNSTDFGETISRVPVLGSIPGLEYLFSSRSQSNAETTFFVFIKPMIFRDNDFDGLKYLSERDLETAGLSSDYPYSEPMLMD